MSINKNFKLLSLYSLSYIEKYFKELINLCFEYTSNFIFSYNLNSFKNICLKNLNINYNSINNVTYLLNLYLEKDCFYSQLFTLVNLKSKLTFNQLFQIIGIKGSSSFIDNNNILLSNLYYGLSLKDFIYSSFTCRTSVIDSGLNISESGYLTRKLIESLRDTYIKCVSCRTKYSYIDTHNNKTFKLPFLCCISRSICLKCLGLDTKNIIMSGYNKGIICGQALGEPSTQMMLRTFHLGDKNVFKNILNLNKINYKSFNISVISYYIKQYTCILPYKTLSNYIINIQKHTKLNKYNIISFSYNIFNDLVYLLMNNYLNNLWGFSTLYKSLVTYDYKDIINIYNTNCINYF